MSLLGSCDKTTWLGLGEDPFCFLHTLLLLFLEKPRKDHVDRQLTVD